MAFSNLTVKQIKGVNSPMTQENYTSLTTALATNGESSATYGVYLEMNQRDDKYMFLVQNTDTDPHTVTVRASNAMQGVNDLSVSVAASKYTVFTIDSGRFKWISANDGYADLAKTIPHAVSTSGFTEKGKVFITSDSDTVKVAAFVLPV